VTAERLRARGIERLVDVRTVDSATLREAVGSMADWLQKLANGHDDRPVVPHRDAKSSGTENTYPEDLTDINVMRHEIREMASHAVSWLARKGLYAKTVTIKVRYTDFTTITRSQSAPPSRDPAGIAARAVELLDRTEAARRPVRLLGVSVHNFCDTMAASAEPIADQAEGGPHVDNRLPFEDGE
jgi:DNA polymerase-4